MNVLLAITSEQYAEKIISTAGFFETLGFGAMMLGIGMLAVFSVLCILWGALILFKIGFYDLPAKKKTEKAAEAPAPVSAASVAPVQNDEEELIAVFAAAIAMAESECTSAKFRVVSFNRK